MPDMSTEYSFLYLIKKCNIWSTFEVLELNNFEIRWNKTYHSTIFHGAILEEAPYVMNGRLRLSIGMNTQQILQLCKSC